MNNSIESLLRLVNLTTSGLLAGSLGFGENALTPGWESERPTAEQEQQQTELARYLNAIGPIALASSLALAVAGSNRSVTRKTLDAASAVGLAGVLGTTILVTVPISKKLDTAVPVDYESEETASLNRNWSRAHAVRTALGIGAFLCAAASNVMRRK